MPSLKHHHHAPATWWLMPVTWIKLARHAGMYAVWGKHCMSAKGYPLALIRFFVLFLLLSCHSFTINVTGMPIEGCHLDKFTRYSDWSSDIIVKYVLKFFTMIIFFDNDVSIVLILCWWDMLQKRESTWSCESAISIILRLLILNMLKTLSHWWSHSLHFWEQDKLICVKLHNIIIIIISWKVIR